MAEQNIYTTKGSLTGIITYRCVACGGAFKSKHAAVVHECDTLLLGSIGNTPKSCPWDQWKPSKDL